MFFSDFGGMDDGGGSGLFSMLAGGRGRGRRRKGEDTVQPLHVTLEDLYKGKTTKLQLTKKAICSDCEGRGGKAGASSSCQRCRGQGRVIYTRQVGPGMIQQMQGACDECDGEGSKISEKDKCRKCSGRKTVQQQKILEVKIQPGMRENQKVTFVNEGDQEPGIEAGDVILVVKTKPHEVFQRKGDDLVMQQKVSINEALCGFTRCIDHLGGRKIVLKTPQFAVIKPDAVHCVRGEGMPIKGTTQRGSLYIVYDINFPENHFLSEDGYKKLEAHLPSRPKETLPLKGENIEEVSIIDFDERRHGGKGSGRREAYQDEEGSDEEGPGGPGGQRVQCASH